LSFTLHSEIVKPKDLSYFKKVKKLEVLDIGAVLELPVYEAIHELPVQKRWDVRII
jgi:hypothetical protein